LAGSGVYTAFRWIDRTNDYDVVDMISSSGFSTGLGYFGVAGAVVLFIVDILALTNPSIPSDQFLPN